MDNKTIRRLFGLVFGFLTAAGTFKALDHDTTAYVLFVGAVLLFFLTAIIWMERTVSRLRATRAVEKPPDSPPGDDVAPLNAIVFNPPWTAYTEDVFHDVIWRWH